MRMRFWIERKNWSATLNFVVIIQRLSCPSEIIDIFNESFEPLLLYSAHLVTTTTTRIRLLPRSPQRDQKPVTCLGLARRALGQLA